MNTGNIDHRVLITHPSKKIIDGIKLIYKHYHEKNGCHGSFGITKCQYHDYATRRGTIVNSITYYKIFSAEKLNQVPVCYEIWEEEVDMYNDPYRADIYCRHMNYDEIPEFLKNQLTWRWQSCMDIELIKSS